MNVLAERRAALRALLLGASRAEGWLNQQRWYADKGRAVTSSEVTALRLEPAPAGTLALLVVQFRYADGGKSRYFIPLYLAQETESVEPPLGRIGPEVVLDATTQRWFGDWLLHAFQQQTPGWPSTLGPDSETYLGRAAAAPVQVLRGEQSNTSIRFGDAIIVKLFRKLQPGVNPDEEALRVLSGQGFGHAPTFVGSLAWAGPDGVDYPLALASSFVPHETDGWSWLLSRLQGVAAGGDVDLEPERLLGQRTAEMHQALAAASDESFRPRASTAEDVFASQARTRTGLRQAAELIQERAEALPADLQEALPRIFAALHAAESDVAGFDAEVGAPRIRTHGDYHLGQILRTADDWVILDFEGEPARPIEERRLRASALKDVAGMLRSFAYARGATMLSLPEHDREMADSRLRDWEQAARAAFLGAYRETASRSQWALVPDNEAAFERALRAWELDKALYEVAYEARNRPDWLAIPLAVLMPA